jgi:hypothetical protein
MNGRRGAYTLSDRDSPGMTALSVVFNDRCDMVVATAVLPHKQVAMGERAVMDFLNSATVLRWAEVTLGL